ncbi:MAG: hypothetical protein MRZ79_06140 [Bacteroidia bacterium]|nr:hypothetical protein [Bacteroidia bacterium]
MPKYIPRLSILIACLLFLSIQGNAQFLNAKPDWLKPEIREGLFPENSYWKAFNSRVLEKDQDVQEVLEDAIGFVQEEVARSILTKVEVSTSLRIKNENINNDTKTSQSFIVFSKSNTKLPLFSGMKVEAYRNRKALFVFAFVEKQEIKASWENTFSKKLKDGLDKSNILLGRDIIRSSNVLYQELRPFKEDLDQLSEVLTIVFGPLSESLAKDMTVLNNNWNRIQDKLQKPVWDSFEELMNSRSRPSLTLTGIEAVYQHPAYINFDVQLPTKGYVQVFLVNNYEEDNLVNLYPNVGFKSGSFRLEQVYERLSSTAPVHFPYGFDVGMLVNGKQGYGIGISRGATQEECSILLIFGEKDFSPSFSKAKSLGELKKMIQAYQKKYSSSKFEAVIKPFMLKR